MLSCILVAGCYFPPKYTDAEMGRFRAEKMGIELPYDTSAGRQVAYYISPSLRPDKPPGRIVVVYPGMGARALDWMHIIDQAPESSVGFLLIDYPGCGDNEGMIRPKYLYESSAGAVEALERHFNFKGCDTIFLLAHSFGCAAALEFSTTARVEKMVLIAPFTTLHDIAYKKSGPLAWLIPDRMDNGEYLRELHRRIPRPEVTIIHGDQDQVVPVTMGRELFHLFPSWIRYREIRGAGHTDVIQQAEEIFFQILLS
jgi:pimeloyl-ACP methyl ester carboxylesterase